MVTVAVPLPPGLVAVTVGDVDEETSVGVPQIVPLLVSKTRPVGSVGEIDHETTEPPVLTAVAVVIDVPFVSVNELGER